MPELPEVETVVRGLRSVITGKTITDVRLNAPPATVFVSRSLTIRNPTRLLLGKTVQTIDRRGKNILITLSGGLTLWVHLKMTGRFLWVPRDNPYDNHDLAVIEFRSDGAQSDKRHLRFNDYRRFGRLRLFPTRELWDQPGLGDLGPEPLEISATEFVNRCQGRRRMIKPALLDQTFLAGLGNIYADEALHCTRIHPRRLISSLSRKKLVELHGHIQSLLRKSIRLMGTTVDSYTGVNSKPGKFQKHLQAYGFEGKPCKRCSTAIVREKIGSRSAFFCRRCQRFQ